MKEANSLRNKITESSVSVHSAGLWFRQELLFPTFGITPEAARKYRSGGKWLQGKHWRVDPANRIVYSRNEIEQWLGGK
ncbi:DNA-binding protein [Pseudomonas plecoglossicida]|uniref:DNA-binding protein n=1 Tax=Pseudomonas plecoglossicida TaxID=70775 RepID=UPI0009DDB385|nr:DNA-binding protein [Pseudomonas plecoglossicida]